MKHFNRIRASAVMFGLLVLVLAPLLAVAEPSTSTPCDLPAGELTVRTLPEGSSVIKCDAIGRTLRLADLTVAVPAPGDGVSVEVMYADGATDVAVNVNAGGLIDYDTATARSGEPAPSTAGGAVGESSIRVGGPPECHQARYKLYTPAKQRYGQWQWYAGDGKHPAGVTDAQFAAIAEDSVNNLTQGFNDCGRPDKVDVTQAFKGMTTLESNILNIGHDISCGDRDGVSVIDAGPLADASAVAATCSWTTAHTGRSAIVEADIKVDIVQFQFTTSPGPGCRDNLDVESVLTHEAGHAFGLDHVSESETPRLTMSTATARCDISPRTLGAGDLNGLEDLY